MVIETTDDYNYSWCSDAYFQCGLIEEHYPGVLLGTNALKTLITIKYIKYKIYAHLYKNMVTLSLTLNSIFKFLSFDIYNQEAYI